MPRGDPLPAAFRDELQVLAATDLSYAEAWRRLIPLAADVGLPRPSYPTVQRFLAAERTRLARRRLDREEMLADLVAGRYLRLLRHVQ